MKKVVFVLACALLFAGGIMRNSVQAAEGVDKSEKPKFTEESMRKFEVTNTTVQLEKGTMWIYDLVAC